MAVDPMNFTGWTQTHRVNFGLQTARGLIQRCFCRFPCLWFAQSVCPCFLLLTLGVSRVRVPLGGAVSCCTARATHMNVGRMGLSEETRFSGPRCGLRNSGRQTSMGSSGVESDRTTRNDLTNGSAYCAADATLCSREIVRNASCNRRQNRRE